MPRFYVNTKGQENGDHEVHELNKCDHEPTEENRLYLGYHFDCRSAVEEAKQTYSQSNGCYYCCRPCHTS